MWRREKTLETPSRSLRTILVESIPKSLVWNGGALMLLAVLGFVVLTSKDTTRGRDQRSQTSESGTNSQEPYPGSYGQPVTLSKQAKSQSSSSPLSVSERQNAMRGKAVLQRLAERHQDVQPVVWGLATANPALALFIPKTEWRRLSKEDQVSLTWYLESLIPTAQGQPEQYIEEFRSSAVYETFRSTVASLCVDCWVIAVGHRTADAKSLLFDKVVVQGDSLWEKADLNNRGVRASEFRGVSRNTLVTSSQETLGEEEKEK
jgi:hypothetical protein